MLSRPPPLFRTVQFKSDRSLSLGRSALTGLEEGWGADLLLIRAASSGKEPAPRKEPELSVLDFGNLPPGHDPAKLVRRNSREINCRPSLGSRLTAESFRYVSRRKGRERKRFRPCVAILCCAILRSKQFIYYSRGLAHDSYWDAVLGFYCYDRHLQSLFSYFLYFINIYTYI